MTLLRHGLAGLLLLCSGAAMAASEVAVPQFQAYVTDLAGLLQPPQRAALEQKLAAFARERGSEVALLILPTTQPETIEQYAIRVAEAWKPGRAQQDDGLLLVMARNDRTLRIEVGYGLEGAIPDAIAKRVIEETILPRFRQNDYYGGLDAGIEQLFGLIRGEALPPPQQTASGQDPLGALAPLLFGALIVGQFLRRALGPLLGGLVVGGGLFGLGWLISGVLGLGLLLGIGGFVLTLVGLASMGGGGWGTGGGFGHGRGGGFGGGGFGGGGGGGFGGGGASGRW